MTTRTATRTESSVLIRALALVIAERDGIHPAHAANRVRAACQLIDAAETMPLLGYQKSPIQMSNGLREMVAERAGVQASSATWDVAALIHEAEMEVF